MEGDDDVNGPEWDKSSIEVDGDTSQNAGVFNNISQKATYNVGLS